MLKKLTTINGDIDLNVCTSGAHFDVGDGVFVLQHISVIVDAVVLVGGIGLLYGARSNHVEITGFVRLPVSLGI